MTTKNEIPKFKIDVLPPFELKIYNGLDIVETKFFETTKEIADYLGEKIIYVYRAQTKKHICKKDGRVYKIEKNFGKYVLQLEGSEPEEMPTIRAICMITKWPYYKIKAMIDVIKARQMPR
jgi:hypothetical protein